MPPKIKRVGKYALGKTLGQGTFGKVKYAVNTETNVPVALKIMDKAKIKAARMGAQIKKEIRVLKLLNHPTCIKLIEVLASDDVIFLVMELISGGELFDRVVAHGRFSEDQARHYFIQLIDGLDHCHSLGVCHRDLKPENLLLDASGGLKITDFGLASINENPSMTQILHTPCGTPNYVAPEVLMEKGYDGCLADVWSAGVILYLLVSGFLPFDEAQMVDLFRKIVVADYQYPAWLSREVQSLIGRMLEPNVERRATIEEIRQSAWYCNQTFQTKDTLGTLRRPSTETNLTTFTSPSQGKEEDDDDYDEVLSASHPEEHHQNVSNLNDQEDHQNGQTTGEGNAADNVTHLHENLLQIELQQQELALMLAHSLAQTKHYPVSRLAQQQQQRVQPQQEQQQEQIPNEITATHEKDALQIPPTCSESQALAIQPTSTGSSSSSSSNPTTITDTDPTSLTAVTSSTTTTTDGHSYHFVQDPDSGFNMLQLGDCLYPISEWYHSKYPGKRTLIDEKRRLQKRQQRRDQKTAASAAIASGEATPLFDNLNQAQSFLTAESTTTATICTDIPSLQSSAQNTSTAQPSAQQSADSPTSFANKQAALLVPSTSNSNLAAIASKTTLDASLFESTASDLGQTPLLSPEPLQRVATPPEDEIALPKRLNAFDLINMVSGQSVNNMLLFNSAPEEHPDNLASRTALNHSSRGDSSIWHDTDMTSAAITSSLPSNVKQQVKSGQTSHQQQSFTQFTSKSSISLLLKRLDYVLLTMPNVKYRINYKRCHIHVVWTSVRNHQHWVQEFLEVYNLGNDLHMVRCQRTAGSVMAHSDFYKLFKDFIKMLENPKSPVSVSYLANVYSVAVASRSKQQSNKNLTESRQVSIDGIEDSESTDSVQPLIYTPQATEQDIDYIFQEWKRDNIVYRQDRLSRRKAYLLQRAAAAVSQVGLEPSALNIAGISTTTTIPSPAQPQQQLYNGKTVHSSSELPTVSSFVQDQKALHSPLGGAQFDALGVAPPPSTDKHQSTYYSSLTTAGRNIVSTTSPNSTTLSPPNIPPQQQPNDNTSAEETARQLRLTTQQYHQGLQTFRSLQLNNNRSLSKKPTVTSPPPALLPSKQASGLKDTVEQPAVSATVETTTALNPSASSHVSTGTTPTPAVLGSKVSTTTTIVTPATVPVSVGRLPEPAANTGSVPVATQAGTSTFISGDFTLAKPSAVAPGGVVAALSSSSPSDTSSSSSSDDESPSPPVVAATK